MMDLKEVRKNDKGNSNPVNSRSLVVLKGKVRDETFELSGEFYQQSEIKCFWEKFDSTPVDSKTPKKYKRSWYR